MLRTHVAWQHCGTSGSVFGITDIKGAENASRRSIYGGVILVKPSRLEAKLADASMVSTSGDSEPYAVDEGDGIFTMPANANARQRGGQ